VGGGGGSNDDRNTKNKIKKYKSQIERLKEKIRNQNVDIEEALKRLSV
jgi:peptidoglycan hydrolase CwlO-like protein